MNSFAPWALKVTFEIVICKLRDELKKDGDEEQKMLIGFINQQN